MSTLETLISMGFPEKSASRALEVTGNKSVEEAMEWLLAHADDPQMQTTTTATDTGGGSTVGGATAAAPAAEGGATAVEGGGEEGASAEDKMDTTDKSTEAEAKSIKCDECEKLFRTPEEVEFHAVKSGHSSFSESTEEKAPLTEEQKKQKLVEIEEKLKARRKEKEEEKEKENREKEKKRIEMGKNVAEIKRKHDEAEIRKVAEEKRKEKLEDKIARQKVKDMIEADKLARRQKLAEARGEVVPVAPKPVVPAPVSVPGVKKTYDEARIQFRLPSGPPVIQSFKSKEPLSAVLLWLTLNHPNASPAQSTSLSTTFPRKIFADDDMEKPLDILGLVPSSVLMVQYK